MYLLANGPVRAMDSIDTASDMDMGQSKGLFASPNTSSRQRLEPDQHQNQAQTHDELAPRRSRRSIMSKVVIYTALARCRVKLAAARRLDENWGNALALPHSKCVIGLVSGRAAYPASAIIGTGLQAVGDCHTEHLVPAATRRDLTYCHQILLQCDCEATNVVVKERRSNLAAGSASLGVHLSPFDLNLDLP